MKRQIPLNTESCGQRFPYMSLQATTPFSTPKGALLSKARDHDITIIRDAIHEKRISVDAPAELIHQGFIPKTSWLQSETSEGKVSNTRQTQESLSWPVYLTHQVKAAWKATRLYSLVKQGT